MRYAVYVDDVYLTRIDTVDETDRKNYGTLTDLVYQDYDQLPFNSVGEVRIKDYEYYYLWKLEE